MPTRLHLYCTTTPVVIIFRQQRFSKQRIILTGHAPDKNGAGGPPLSRARFQSKLIFLAQNTKKKEQSIDRRHARLSNQVPIDPIPIGRWAQPCLESPRPEQCAAPCFVTLLCETVRRGRSSRGSCIIFHSLIIHVAAIANLPDDSSQN